MKKVLIVEDDKQLIEALSIHLSKKGYEVAKAYDGIQGLQVALDKKPDIVLLDVLMPKRNGLEMLEDLRNTEEIKDIPVIILSNVAPSESKVIETLVKEQPYFYLLKSDWSLEEITEKIEEVLQ